MTVEDFENYKVPAFDNEKELADFIQEMIKNGNSYNNAPYAMALSAYAAFDYVARKLGVTGFQASYADLHFLKLTRKMEDGFQILNYSLLLYPQFKYRFDEISFDKLIKDNLPHLQEKAKKLLAEDGKHAATAVVNHWKKIIAMEVKEGGKVEA